MTQIRTKFQVFTGVHPILSNDTLIALTHRHMKATPIEWTTDEQPFARTIQKEMKLPEKGLATAVAPNFRRIGLRRRELQYPIVGFRLAYPPAWRCPANLGRHSMWRHV
jgi:hypothetical protein